MQVTHPVVGNQTLTTRMVTHSMEQAMHYGDRTVMRHRGGVVADLTGEARTGMTEADLLQRFAELRGTVELKVTEELRALRAVQLAGG